MWTPREREEYFDDLNTLFILSTLFPLMCHGIYMGSGVAYVLGAVCILFGYERQALDCDIRMQIPRNAW